MQIYKCRHISVQKQIFSYLLLFFSTTFMKKIGQTRHMHAASHITDINTNVCSIIRLLSGNWLICHVDHVNIRKSFMYVIEVDFIVELPHQKNVWKKVLRDLACPCKAKTVNTDTWTKCRSTKIHQCLWMITTGKYVPLVHILNNTDSLPIAVLGKQVLLHCFNETFWSPHTYSCNTLKH